MGDYWSEEEIDQLEELRGSGLSFDDIGPSLGRSVHSVKAKWKTVQEHSQFDWEAKARAGSARLLAALKKNHRQSEIDVVGETQMTAPESTPDPQPVLAELLPPTIRNIKSVVAAQFKVSVRDLNSQRRTNDIIYPRQLGYYMCRLLTLHSYPEIGRRFGHKHHTTVLHSCRLIESMAKTDAKVAGDIETIKRAFNCENDAEV